MATAQTNHKIKSSPTYQLLNKVLREIRSLRQEFSLILPQEDLKEYTHPERIRRFYQKAVKKYPPSAISK